MAGPRQEIRVRFVSSTTRILYFIARHFFSGRSRRRILFLVFLGKVLHFRADLADFPEGGDRPQAGSSPRRWTSIGAGNASTRPRRSFVST